MLDNRSVAVMRINHTKFPLAKIVNRLEVKDGLDLWHIVVCRHDDGCTLYLVGVCFLELDVIYLVALDGQGRKHVLQICHSLVVKGLRLVVYGVHIVLEQHTSGCIIVAILGVFKELVDQMGYFYGISVGDSLLKTCQGAVLFLLTTATECH